jgi:sulfide:quinone oxidoreductase
MLIKQVTTEFSVADQITPDDIAALSAQGVKTILCHRPDDESADQPSFSVIQKAAEEHGIAIEYLPVTITTMTDNVVARYAQMYAQAQKPILGYCRSGMRAISLWALSGVDSLPISNLLQMAQTAGFDLKPLVPKLLKKGTASLKPENTTIVIVGGGSAGISVASSLLARSPNVQITIIDPAETHYYQPGWTMVGAGLFSPESTARKMASVMPAKVKWMKAIVAGFDPENHEVILEGGQSIRYSALIICAGLKLNWNGIEGLTETLGKNGVTSNYRYDLAPYTWKLVQELKRGKAIFTQPPMPIKCAGAPQKAMYLSADYWLKQNVLKDISVEMFNAGAVLFGVKEYAPALMSYVEKYNAKLKFGHQLVKVDGSAKRAWFKTTSGDTTTLVESDFDLLHVVPPQQAPDFIRSSTLTDDNGWVSVNQQTLQHTQYADIFSLGDVMNAPNAKTVAAARKQAPIVAANVLAFLDGREQFFSYDGYGACPLTVERGKIVLAEFGYGGKLLPSFPNWLIDGQKPSHLAWILKAQVLPPVYWQGMLKGHEWLVKPDSVFKP